MPRIASLDRGLRVILTCILASIADPGTAANDMIVDWRVHDLNFGDQERATLVNGANVYRLNLTNHAAVNIADGAKVDVASLRDDARLRILGGEIAMLEVGGNAQAEIRRANLKEIYLPVETGAIQTSAFKGSGLSVSGTATVHLHVWEARFENGQLLGTFENGEEFSIWMLTPLITVGEPRYRITTTLPRNIVVHDLTGPGFDCTKAATTVEKLICNHPVAARLDRQLSLLYKKLVRDSALAKDIVASQHRWLTTSRNRCQTNSCLDEAYRVRIAELEKISGKFNRTFLEKLCAEIADPARRQQILRDRNHVDDINNDGYRETIRACDGGTMHAPCSEYYDRSGRLLTIRPVGHEWKMYMSFGVDAFRFGALTFFLNSYDDHLTQPAYVSYVAPDNREYLLCEFENGIAPTIERTAPDSSAICEAAIGRRDGATFLTPEDSTIVWGEQQLGYRIGSASIMSVDIDNDGSDDQIVPRYFDSGAGRGCTTNFYEIAVAGNVEPSRGSSATRFQAMQNLEEGYARIGCGSVKNRLFRYKGKTYFEHNYESSDSARHTVSIMHSNDTQVICEYGKRVETSVSAVSPRTPHGTRNTRLLSR